MCDNCPITAAFDVAEKLLAEFSAAHEDPESALGILAVHRRCAEAVQQNYPCPGVTTDRDGRVICPLSAVISDTAQMSAYHSNPIAVRLTPPSAETGLFL